MKPKFLELYMHQLCVHESLLASPAVLGRWSKCSENPGVVRTCGNQSHGKSTVNGGFNRKIIYINSGFSVAAFDCQRLVKMYGKKTWEHTPEVFEFALKNRNCKMIQGHQFGDDWRGSHHGSREENKPFWKFRREKKHLAAWFPICTVAKKKRYNMV